MRRSKTQHVRRWRCSMLNKKKNHRNIPIFIPHMGCPNMCVFCNQRAISGKTCFERENVRIEIENALRTIPRDCEVEIAYFGGSFTGIDRGLMIYLLDLAQSFIDRDNGYARVTGIRMSTRPDYINKEILDILSKYTVSAVELGLQSMDDNVLIRSKRGHNAECAEAACKMITERGYSLVGQMMIGLPGSTLEGELETARKICELGADGARIYPTVVFYDTELAEMAKRGEYKMLDCDDAVARSAAVLEVFEDYGVECIRIGLCASDNLSDSDKVMGGANHPAMGELVLGEYFFRRMCSLIDKSAYKGRAVISFTVPAGRLSAVIGQRGRNRERLKKIYKFEKIIVREGDVSEITLDSID